MSEVGDTVRPHRAVLEALAAWLSDCLGQAVDADAMSLDRPAGGGWSNETWMVATGLADPARVVVRLQPDRPSMFPSYDMARQLACLDVMRDDPDVPVPAVHAADPDGDRLGRPAFVMELVPGRVPRDDSPTFAEAGWLHDATPDQQRRFHTSFLAVVAAIHRTDTALPTLAPLHPHPGTDTNAAAVRVLRDLWEWDRGERWPPEIDAAVDRLAADIPDPTGDALLWGDARPANVIVAADGFEPVAVIDWELAAIGSPEQDLTWFLEMNHMRMQGAGLDPLPGFLTDDRAVECYRRHSGRRLEHLTWYRYLAAVKVAVLMHRYLRALVHAGRLPADHKLFTATVASRRLAELRP